MPNAFRNRYVRADRQKKFEPNNFLTHNHQTRTIYTFIIYKYSLPGELLITSALFLALLVLLYLDLLWLCPRAILRCYVSEKARAVCDG